MIKNLRLLLPVTALVAAMATGCMLVSGQFIIPFEFADVGADPLTVNSTSTLSNVRVDLNTEDVYNDHKENLKDIVDMALLGTITNLESGSAVDVEVWLVPTTTTTYTTDTAVKGAPGAVQLWGPLTIPAGGTKKITWDQSAALFKGRQKLITEIKGDGVFDLYAFGNGLSHFRVDKGVLMLVVSAGK